MHIVKNRKIILPLLAIAFLVVFLCWPVSFNKPKPMSAVWIRIDESPQLYYYPSFAVAIQDAKMYEQVSLKYAESKKLSQSPQYNYRVVGPPRMIYYYLLLKGSDGALKWKHTGEEIGYLE